MRSTAPVERRRELENFACLLLNKSYELLVLPVATAVDRVNRINRLVDLVDRSVVVLLVPVRVVVVVVATVVVAITVEAVVSASFRCACAGAQGEHAGESDSGREGEFLERGHFFSPSWEGVLVFQLAPLPTVLQCQAEPLADRYKRIQEFSISRKHAT